MHWSPIIEVEKALSNAQIQLQIAGLQLLLVNDSGQIHLIRDRCSHAGKPLYGGKVMAGRITCRYHGATFDLNNGSATSLPGCTPIETYPIRIQGSYIEANIPSEKK